MTVRIRFTGPDPRSGRQIEGVTYHPGDEADLPEHWARVLVGQGMAVAVPPSTPDRVATAEVEHRDDFPTRKRRKRS